MEVNSLSGRRTALVHHWLVTYRGGERALEALSDLFPSADLFTLVYERSQMSASLKRHHLRSSFLQRLPRPSRWYPYYLPLFPLATERMDLTGYDLVISSDAATMKGVRVSPHAVHICYCYTPMRYIWSESAASSHAVGPIRRLALRTVRTYLREWDYQAAQRVTHFVAISEAVKKRIHDAYGRKSAVIYPPVDTERFVVSPLNQTAPGFFLFVSQLVPYKRADLLIEAFNRCGRPLLVIGDGPERRRLQEHAKPNIQFLGPQPQHTVIEAMQQCRAFVFAGEEDFGIVMGEAQACGRPVIALGRGGAREIVEDGTTGILFEEQSADSLLDGLERFQRIRFDASTIRASALKFARPRFLREFAGWLNQMIGGTTELEGEQEGILTPSSCL